ncbi:MAG: helix-turn-helix domain-containing protein [Alphaproteobacteria bacterium]|nr:helix-turn-helix domain-containing protein [Alphaproteobacteria bacterium]
MVSLVRSASLTGFSDLCQRLGADARKLASAAGVPAAALQSPDLKIDSGRVDHLLDLAAQRTGAEDFGLQLATARKLSNLGPVGLVARDQANLREALAVMRQYLWLHNEALAFALEELEEIVILRVEFVTSGSPASRQAAELCVGVLHASIQSLLGGRWLPDEILFRHQAPTNMWAYRRLFGKAPLFSQDFNGLVLLRGDLERPLLGADPAMARQAERIVASSTRVLPNTERRQVAELIMLLLPTGTCSAERVATHLGIDRRTLHRHLKVEGTCFREVLEEQRKMLAAALIADGRTITAVSALTGFRSVSAFSSWFHRCFAMAPRAYRKRAKAP